MNMPTDPSARADEQLKDFFQSRRPAVGDGGIFLDTLQARLLAVEEIKRMKAAQTRRTRKLLGIVFLCGVLAGMLLVLLMQAFPLPDTPGGLLSWFQIVPTIPNSLLAWLRAVPAAVQYLLCALVAAAALVPSLKALASD